MRVFLDSHVHIYPFHDVGASFDAIIANLPCGQNGDFRMACLTERYDCALFEDLLAGRVPGISGRYRAESTESGSVLKLVRNDDQAFYLVAGQQIVTSENIEILALNMLERVSEGQNAGDTVESVLAAGGLPVVAWAPGKWFGSRGEVVKSLLDRFTPRQIALGDTSLRPLEWPTPFIMRAAEHRGFRVLAGSDPLPFAGEEIRPGCYFSIADTGRGTVMPDAWLTGLLNDPDTRLSPGRRRPGITTVATRMLRHKRAG